jgi:hypothetical protein
MMRTESISRRAKTNEVSPSYFVYHHAEGSIFTSNESECQKANSHVCVPSFCLVSSSRGERLFCRKRSQRRKIQTKLSHTV